MSGYLRLLLILLVCILCCDHIPEADFVPADFEENEATMMCWNLNNQEVVSSVIKEISQHDQVHLFFNEKLHDLGHISSLLQNVGSKMEHITFLPFQLEKDNIWIRDFGPAFTVHSGTLAMMEFNYPHEKMGEYRKFTRQIAPKLRIPFRQTELRGTGGGRLINGKGTILLIEGYEKEINPDMSKDELEIFYKEEFHQKKIIWLKRGIPQDDFPVKGPILDNVYGMGANWHIDEFCRFSDPQTILLADVSEEDIKIDPLYSILKERLDENYELLKRATDQDGNHFKIIRVPSAPIFFSQGTQGDNPVYYTPVTSYLNFVVTNSSVIVPKYYEPGDPIEVQQKDLEVAQIISEAFPTRRIVQINPLSLNFQGGGMRCITLEYPKHAKPKKRRLG